MQSGDVCVCVCVRVCACVRRGGKSTENLYCHIFRSQLAVPLTLLLLHVVQQVLLVLHQIILHL